MDIRRLSIEQVQRWVVSFLIISVSVFPSGALIAASNWLSHKRHGDAVVLIVIMAILGMIAFSAARIVHRKSPLSPWTLLGALPAIIAGFLVL